MEEKVVIDPEEETSPEFDALRDKILSCAFGEWELELYHGIEELLPRIPIIQRLIEVRRTFMEKVLSEAVTSAVAVKALYDPTLLDKLEALDISI
ncbi:hypothetical protein [Candidatus Solincola tengchongensis]|uniref:hypothetical protein n=1 Tax=Candidatus Solincola tengchongensis TaxID=2900693 RepID=UPI002580570E|nr:hypothetical protein [Candidatus Solincola tengchongensis]